MRIFIGLLTISTFLLFDLKNAVVTCDKMDRKSGSIGSSVHVVRRMAGGSVSVEYSSGTCKCKGLELRSPGSGPRTLKLNCKKDATTVNCEYKGNPHGCSAYNNGGQEKFYQQVLNGVGSKICSLPSNNMICPKGRIDDTRICGDLGKGKNFVYISGP